MKFNSLKYTKRNLTIIFTFLVFFIALLLEIVFFSAKYYNYIYSEKSNFYSITRSVEDKTITLKEFVTKYDIWKRLFRMSDKSEIKKEELKNFLNLIIIDRNKTELVFSNVVDNLSVKFVEKSFNDSRYWEVYQEDWYLVRKIMISEWNNDYDVLFIKNLRYSFADYLRDLFDFVLITFLFSIFFYYIWFKFVSTNLRPVEENMKDMQDFIHNAWHELKTPISIIHSNLQLINQTKKYEKELIDEGLEEVSRLNKLIESLVELSNICSSHSKEKVNLSEEIRFIIKDFKNKAWEKNIDVDFIEKSTKILNINKQYFYILLSNLLWNAIKYSKKGSKIEITLKNRSIIVKDNGRGIKNDDLDKIFDRFFMWKQGRNVEWYGIWLSLVKKISDIYKWKIVVNSIEGVWTEFIIKF